MADRERVVEEELPPEERALPPGARPRRAWVPWAVLAVVAVLVISVVAAYQLGAFRTPQAPLVTGVAADKETANVGETITFNALARDPQGGTLTYQWDFGDGTNSPGAATVQHGYLLPGNFIVLLTVKNGVGTRTNDNNLTFVTVNKPVPKPENPPATGGAPPAPAAIAAVDNNIPVLNQVIKFSANASWQYTWTPKKKGDLLNGSWDPDTSAVTKYTWTFGDASPDVTGDLAKAGVVSYNYPRIGNWFAKLVITSPSGTADYGLTVRAAPQITTGIRNPTILNEAVFGEPQFLDPASDYETAGGEILLNVYETPVFFKGASTTELVPLLATEVPTIANGGISADGTTYNFKIRANVKFHDGTPLTAEDVAFSWKRPIFINDPEGPSWMMDSALFVYLVANYLDTCGPKGDTPCPTSDYLTGLTYATFTPPQWLKDALASHPIINEGAIKAALDAAIFVNTAAGTPPGTVGVVTVRLVRPYPAFIKISAYTVMDVVSKKFVNDHGGDQFNTQNAFMIRNTMGTGPFRLRVWQPNQLIILDRFDQYWRTPARLKQVNIIKVQDITTRELQLFSGQADVASIPRNHIYDVVDRASGQTKPGLLIDKDKPTFIINFIGFNQKINLTNRAKVGDTFTNVPSTFFADKHLRKAFSYAFDYDTFINSILFGGGARSYGPIPDGMFGFSKTNLFTFSPDKAKAELQAAQVTDRSPNTAGAACPTTATNWFDCGFKIRIYYNSGNLVREQGAYLLQKEMQKLSDKIKVDVVGLDWPVYLSTVSGRKKAVATFFLGWAPDFADPDDYATPFLHSTAGFYPARMSYKNITLDGLIDTAAIEVNEAKRMQLYAQIQKSAYEDDVPAIWTHQSVTFIVMKDWVKGFVSNPMTTANGMLLYYELSKGR